MNPRLALAAAAPAAALSLVTAYVVAERRHPKPMSPTWSFTLEGKARVKRAGATIDDIGVKPGLEVLEIGCGPGVILEAAARRTTPGALHAVDVQPEMVTRARKRLADRGITDVDIRRADAAALPHPDDSFELVYMVTVIGEFPDLLAVLGEVRRVLKPGGAFAVTEEIFDPHYTRPSAVRRLCEAAGFRYVETAPGPLQQTSRFTA
jgi:ubiquinone/menaquinone biosynthesis C-methylase UbiE